MSVQIPTIAIVARTSKQIVENLLCLDLMAYIGIHLVAVVNWSSQTAVNLQL